MSYITDAAKEYAKKHTKDAKHSFEEVKNYIQSNIPESLKEYIIDIDESSNDSNDFIVIEMYDNESELELSFIVDYDENCDISNLSMQGIHMYGTGKLKHAFVGSAHSKMPLSKIFDIILSQNNDTNVMHIASVLFDFIRAMKISIKNKNNMIDSYCEKNNLTHESHAFDIFQHSELINKSYEEMLEYVNDNIKRK